MACLGLGIGLPFLSTHGSGFSPLSLFAAGEQGAWYDPSDLSTLFQDAAGTVPVTASGQPVGLMLDKSGRGNHATQVTAASRPTYTESGLLRFLAFDGSDDFLVTGSIDMSATDELTVFAGILKTSNAAESLAIEFSASSTANNGTFALFAPPSTLTGYRFRSRGTVTADPNGAGSAPDTTVLSFAADISAQSALIRRNGAAFGGASSGVDQGTGNYGNFPLYLGRRGGVSMPFLGNLYGVIVRGATSSSAQIQAAEALLAGKSGVTLP